MAVFVDLFERLLASFRQWGVEAVVAGGAVADLVFGHAPRDVDVFAWDTDAARRVAQALGFRAAQTPSGLGGSYRPTVTLVRQVFKGQVDGVPVDLVLVNRDQGPPTLADYVQTHFDLDVKMALYDGRVRLLEPFRRAQEAGTVDVVNWATPLPTAIRLWDVGRRYGLRPGAGFDALLAYFKACWEKDPDRLVRAKLSEKYRDRLEEFLSFLQARPVSGSVETIQLVDLMRALLAGPFNRDVFASGVSERLSAAMRRWLAGKLYLDEASPEVQEFARRVCALTLRTSAALPSVRRLKAGEDLVDGIASCLSRLVFAHGVAQPQALSACGVTLDRLWHLSQSCWYDALRTGKVFVRERNGRERCVRLGKLLTALARCAEQYKDTQLAADFRDLLRQWEQLGPASFSAGKLVISQRIEDLLSITRGRAWHSCMDWKLGAFAYPALSLLANLDGRTAVAILQDDHGGWLARALLRLDAEKEVIWYERVYGVSQDIRDMLLALLMGAVAHEGRIKVRQLTPGAARLGPFICPPYSDVLSTKAEGGYWWLE